MIKLNDWTLNYRQLWSEGLSKGKKQAAYYVVPFAQEFSNAEMLCFGYFGVGIYSITSIFKFF